MATYKVYAEDVIDKTRRYLGDAVGNNIGKGLFDLYADQCEDQEEIVLVPTDTAADIGRKGGQAKSERKAAAARENGKKGGRPTMEMKTWCVLNNENGAFFGTVDAKTWGKALTLAYDVYSRDRRFTLDVISDAEYREKLGL